MTNGEKFKQTFPNSFKVRTFFMQNGTEHIVIDGVDGETHDFVLDWWNAEYKEPTTKNDLGVDCIDRNYATRLLADIYHNSISDSSLKIYQIINWLNQLPSVTPQEPRTGHWIALENRFELGDRVKCSECGQVFVVGDDVSRHYCPNCGAKMIDPQESEEV